MNLKEFIESDIKNIWIEEPNIRVYVRRSLRCLTGNTLEKCLDIASVEVDENKQRQGIFTKFLVEFEQSAKKLNRYVFIESILHEKLLEFLVKRGYEYTDVSTLTCPSLYKKP